MRCDHTTIHAATTGRQGLCSNCGVPVIFNGKRWIWEHSLSPREKKALTGAYAVQRLTERQR